MTPICFFPFPFNVTPRLLTTRERFSIPLRALEGLDSVSGVVLKHLADQMTTAALETQGGLRAFLTNIEQIQTSLPFLKREEIEESLEALSDAAMIASLPLPGDPDGRLRAIHVTNEAMESASRDLLHFDGEVARNHGIDVAIWVEKIWDTWLENAVQGMNVPISNDTVSQGFERVFLQRAVQKIFKTLEDESYIVRDTRPGYYRLSPAAYIAATTGRW